MTDETAVLETPVAPDTSSSQPAEVHPAPRDPEEAMREAVGRQMDKVPGFEVTKPTGEVKTPEQKAAEDKAAADKAAADAAAQTPEQKAAADQAAADAKAVADKAAAEKAAQPPNPLDQGGPLPVETLAKTIADNPALAAELEKAGLDPETLYETSRQAALAEQFIATGLVTPQAAAFAAENAQHFYDIEDGFPKIESLQDFDAYVTNTLLPLSVLRDPATNQPLMNPDGRSYQTDGSIEKFFSRANQMETLVRAKQADALIAEFTRSGNEEGLAEAQRLRDAIVLAQEFQDNGYKLPGQKKETSQRSPEDQALLDQAARERQESARIRSEGQQKADEAYQTGVYTDTMAATTPLITEWLERTSLTANEKALLAEKVHDQTWAALKTNRHFQANKEHLYTLGNSDQNKAAIVSLTKAAFGVEATRILRKELEKAGGKQISKQQAKLAKIDTQVANDRMNQGTGTTPAAKPAATMTSAQIRTQAIENYKAKNRGDMPTDGEILAESFAIRGLGHKS